MEKVEDWQADDGSGGKSNNRSASGSSEEAAKQVSKLAVVVWGWRLAQHIAQLLGKVQGIFHRPWHYN